METKYKQKGSCRFSLSSSRRNYEIVCDMKLRVMSTKKHKSNNSLWYICDICKAIVQMRDTLVHKENSCPVNKETFIHPFFKSDSLYTKIEKLTDEDVLSIKGIPLDRQQDFIFLSTNALQLIKVPIGDPVIVCMKNYSSHIPFVKYAWPISGKNILGCYIAKEVAVAENINCLDNVSIQLLKDKINLAKELIIHIEDDFKILNESDILSKIKEQNLHNIFSIGNKFLYQHYGKFLTLKVIDIKLYDQNAEENINSETDNRNKFDQKFSVITGETILKIFKPLDEESQTSNIIEIGGLSEVIREIEDIVSLALYGEAELHELNRTRGILIFGPGGTGKTSLVEAIAQKFKINIVRIESSQIFSKYLGDSERKLLYYFERAKKLSPSIILIDELEIICPKTNSKSDQEKRIVSTLSTLLDKLHASEESILVFATTSRVDDVDKSLRRPRRFEKEIEIYVPNANQRKEILQVCLKNVKHDLKDSDLKDISDLTHGFVGADMRSLISKAFLRSYKRNNKTDLKSNVSLPDFLWAISKIKPSAMREVLIDIPNVKWSDIGGQDDLILKLKQAVEWPLKYESSFKRLGIVPPRGLLMFGPPGCSKTMIAKALATESKLNFISVKGPELFSKWVGESEKAVREIFRRARQVAPSIIFFDELDAIGGERNHSSSGGSSVEERVLAQLLTELDGVEPLGNVTIVGATNRLDRIDPALLRPGRFDRIVYVPLPDNATRRQIFNIQFKTIPVGLDVNLEELVDKTKGYSGAEIVAVCHEAAMKSLEENFNSSSVLRNHFIIALKIIQPRTPQSLIKIYEKYISK